MKKGTKVILGVVIGVLVAYGAFMTFSLYMAAQDFNELNAKYDDVNAKYGEVLGEKVSAKVDSVLLESFAKLIDENAIVNVSSGECAIIRLNMGEKSLETALAETTKHVTDLTLGVKAAEVETCILLFVDKQGDVVCGLTFHADGTSTTFIRNK